MRFSVCIVSSLTWKGRQISAKSKQKKGPDKANKLWHKGTSSPYKSKVKGFHKDLIPENKNFKSKTIPNDALGDLETPLKTNHTFGNYQKEPQVNSDELFSC